jgi:hypothetical protein
MTLRIFVDLLKVVSYYKDNKNLEVPGPTNKEVLRTELTEKKRKLRGNERKKDSISGSTHS